MRIFVTGATGFAGSHLVDSLLAAGAEIFALTRTLPTGATAQPGLTFLAGDILDAASVQTAVAVAQPDVIYHLAGQAYPARSWADPAFTLAANSGGTANVLQAAVANGRPRVVIVTSAEIYGLIQERELPITEGHVPQPRHPYGVSKWAAGQLVRLYWERYKLPVVEARPFNHIGPRQALGFVVPDFASQLAAIKLGQQLPRLSVGNLDAQRDFTDVRDVVRAYMALADKGQPGQSYLICSGQPVSIHYLLNVLVDLLGVTMEIAYDPTRMRPSDVACLFGSYGKIHRETGWRPLIHLRQTLADVLAEWLQKLNGQK